MEQDGKAASDLALALSIPTDPRFSETVRELSTRVATYVGYAPRDAQVIGETVERAIATIAAHAPRDGGAENVEIRFVTGASRLEIRILFGSARARPVAGSPADVERRFTGGRSGRADLDRIRGVMHVEFGSEGERDCCRLARALPESS